MAAQEIADWLDQVEIDGVVCAAVQSIEFEEDDEALEVVRTITPDRAPLGFKSGADAAYTITLEHKITQPREIDYRTLRRTKKVFGMAWQEGSGDGPGTKFTAPECRVKKIGTSYDTEGNPMDSVEIVALNIEPEPSFG